jgi:hypothetical protein
MRFLLLFLLGTINTATGGCKDRKHDQCTFPRDGMELLNAAKDETSLTVEERYILMSYVVANCRGWPDFMKPVIEALKEGPHGFAQSICKNKDVVFSAKNMRSARRYLDSICPGYSKRFPSAEFTPVGQKSVGRKYREAAEKIYRYCGYSKLGLLTEREFTSPVGAWVVLMYTVLKRGGMKPRHARLLARLWMPIHPESAASLPGSSSETQLLEDGFTVTLSHNLILVEQKAIIQLSEYLANPEQFRRDGPNGFIITELYDGLRDLARGGAHRKMPTMEDTVEESIGDTTNNKVNGGLILEMDEDLSYRLLAEVDFTARQAGWDSIQLRVKNPRIMNQVILIQGRRLPPKSQPPKSPKEVNLVVMVSKDGYHVKSQHGDECPEAGSNPSGPCFPVGKEGRDSALRKLSRHLWHLYSNKYAKSEFWSDDPITRSSIMVTAAEKTPIKEIVSVLDAVRDIPKDVTSPTVPSRGSAASCFFSFDHKKKQWEVDEEGKSVCMFPHVSLGFPLSIREQTGH